MTVLTTYHGIVEEKGTVRLREESALPAGTEVIVVAAQRLALTEQQRRLAALSPEEWHPPFDAVRAAWDRSEPAPDEGKTLTDEDFVDLVMDVRVVRPGEFRDLVAQHQPVDVKEAVTGTGPQTEGGTR